MAAGKARKRKRFVPLERREEILRLTLMDNVFMNVALDGNIPCVEEMLRVILNKPDLNVKKVQTQRMFQGFRRSVCLDVYAEDDEGKRYNIEIQLVSGGASPQRARFLKQEEEGMVIMSNYFERLQEQAVREAEKRSQESIALKFIQLGELTLEKIAQCTGLTIGRVKALARTATA